MPRTRKHTIAEPVNSAVPSEDVMALLAKFRIILQSTRQHYQAIQDSVGIGGAQLQALAIVAAQPNVGISALARAMLIRQPTASNLVEQLVTLGLLQKKKSGVDQRASELTITPKARRLLARAPGPIVGILADALASLSPSARTMLGRSLDAVLQAMKSRDDSARFRPLADS
ncbi:DNA-binding MarR family transcriptional regulator [Dokdonella fugitiva]|uniref:DNA-binding MarR family transcriptional regulator n=1 Tax=Dokdonella fugitiva TaxID=328517 RepID=A0A839F1F1_9GAMM|nr:MarR family winged helix-turn-helix transcriptional regulator [Dokdonella fugitiva]MBA8887872.1 DNA-binding MarR family transcriptional regulator [Dokdonella fugitiva]